MDSKITPKSSGKRWSEWEINFLKKNLDKTNRQLASALDRPYQAVCVKISILGLNRRGLAPRSGVKSEFSEVDLSFLQRNIHQLSSRQLADRLGKALTVVRNKIYEIGLKRSERPEEWTSDQVEFLRRNFREVGDVELGEMMQVAFPGAGRCFDRKTIAKKRKLFVLDRTAEEIQAIRNDERHRARCNQQLDARLRGMIGRDFYIVESSIPRLK